jgi:hypothetical protein
MGLGARTMAFFRRGEELEATNFEALPHDDPMLVPPKLGVRNFDKIPRNRAPVVITVLLIVAAAVAVLGLGQRGRLKTSVGARPSIASTPR